MSSPVRPRRTAPLLRTGALSVTAVVTVLVASGCTASSSSKPVAGAKTVAVSITDAGCTPSQPTVAAGPVTFAVSNKDTGSITEAELQQPDATILGEKENVAPGLSGSFSVSLKPGKYRLYCPGGSGNGYTDFTVTSAGRTAAAAPANPAAASALAAGTTAYADYVRTQVAQLVASTKTLTDAVRAGNLTAAAAAYAAPRVNYERVEPVAEAFGTLDPDIDNRANDVAAGAQWTGFHRLEQAIFAKKSLAGMTPVANALDASVNQLKTLVASRTYQPGTVASGAVELLDEVGATKITGEEERYSHIDLVDLTANVAGSEQAYDQLAPALKLLDPTLATQVGQRFATLDKALTAYSTGAGPTDYVSFSTVTAAQRKMLGQLVDAVAEPLAQVGGQVVSS